MTFNEVTSICAEHGCRLSHFGQYGWIDNPSYAYLIDQWSVSLVSPSTKFQRVAKRMVSAHAPTPEEALIKALHLWDNYDTIYAPKKPAHSALSIELGELKL